MQSEHVDTALGRLRVQVGDSGGEAMLFWPSLLMTGDMWTAQADRFADRYRVILVDPPGHGRSEALTAMFSFADCARSIADVLDALDIERAHVVGNSWGGMIGATFAATYPDQRPLLGAVRTPVLVVAGAEDATFPVAETMAMAAAIPGAATAVLDGVAHLAALENPPLVNTLIQDFLARA